MTTKFLIILILTTIAGWALVSLTLDGVAMAVWNTVIGLAALSAMLWEALEQAEEIPDERYDHNDVQ